MTNNETIIRKLRELGAAQAAPTPEQAAKMYRETLILAMAAGIVNLLTNEALEAEVQAMLEKRRTKE